MVWCHDSTMGGTFWGKGTSWPVFLYSMQPEVNTFLKNCTLQFHMHLFGLIPRLPPPPTRVSFARRMGSSKQRRKGMETSSPNPCLKKNIHTHLKNNPVHVDLINPSPGHHTKHRVLQQQNAKLSHKS